MPEGQLPSWELLTELKRDLCYFYLQQSHYPGIDGDLAFGSTYALPYWDFPGAVGTGEEAASIERGCLLLILAMAWDVIDGSGFYLLEHLAPCRAAIGRCRDAEGSTGELARVVGLALEEAALPTGRREELDAQALWANRTFILAYFQDRAQHLSAAHACLGRVAE